ncbi:MAG: hypothetical protein K6T66_10815 [Peptococcaceae bacterium]|nr:hypothetical protein [Peptococcaceae bacterium]
MIQESFLGMPPLLNCWRFFGELLHVFYQERCCFTFMRNWGKYFLYSFLIFGFLYLSQIIQNNATRGFNIGEYTVLYMQLLQVVIYFIAGVLMGLEYIIEEIKKKGKWAIKTDKLLFIGIPSLFFSLYNIFVNPLYYFGFQKSLVHGIIQSRLSLVILGFTIATSFYKNLQEKKYE